MSASTIVPIPLRRAWVLALAMLLAATSARAQDAATVSPGDVVRVTVYRNADLSGEFVVAEDGTLLHPLYRELRVAGLTHVQLDQALRAHLARFDAEPVFVAQALVRVTVSGEVRQPQVTTVPAATTVFQAVAEAGGVAPTGRANRVLLVREGVSRSLDLTSPTGADAGERVRSGDLIVVERRPTWVRDVLTPAAAIASVTVSLINLLRR